MQLVDFTTLIAACADLRTDWIPGRIEQVYQRDRYRIDLGLRTLKGRGWLTLSWHPQAARICLCNPPPRIPDTFTFSDQLRHQLNGLALVAIEIVSPWERVLDLQFSKRPNDPAIWHLYVEIMGKYSNVILADANNLIVTAAHQVSNQQSSVRPIQTGQPYELPPALTGTPPSLTESQERWQERVSLIPGKISRQLLKSYRGLSPALVGSMIKVAGLDPDQSTESLTLSDWQQLFQYWQKWLEVLGNGEWGVGSGEWGVGSETAPLSSSLSPIPKFQPGWTEDGYNILGWGIIKPAENIQSLLNSYYSAESERVEFARLHNQLAQKLGNSLAKLRQKASGFETRLQESDEADKYRQNADLLMAYLQEWQAGMKTITLSGFETNEPVTITLNPEKNAIQNAQFLYKRHQKLKRARRAVEPLLNEVQEEVRYLEQVEAALKILEIYNTSEDLQTLGEIRDELIQQGYLEGLQARDAAGGSVKSDGKGRQKDRNIPDVSQPYRYKTPSGFELLIGRNNRQNDLLTFRTAGDYDIWFHTQEIAGSHVLLRLQPGSIPEDKDLQFAANLAAHYSQGRQSEQVPVVYTKPKYVYKPKGAKPGMAIYKQETILWGHPQAGKVCLTEGLSPLTP
jgi:predicted ribosome quality control (RQC) complex YloA/Tae2 family protein